MISHPTHPPTLGARIDRAGECAFRVWAPRATSVELHLLGPPARLLPMVRDGLGYYVRSVAGVREGDGYFFRVNGQTDRPDPASRFQPLGVHQPSAVVDPAFAWTDRNWHGLPLRNFILYELHVGTFTKAGTFEAVIPYLTRLKELGITAVELMPVAQFPGAWNWGYDGVHPFAVQNSYGGPVGLKRLVDACHGLGMAIVLDVVYNHLGPEGNYFHEFGPYFTDRHHNPWGAAINMDGPGSDEVRRFFIENALYWLDEYHFDGLRLDAVDSIHDATACPFLQELSDAVRLEGDRQNRRLHTIAESAWNDPFVLRGKELGGCGLDAQWCDDLHHSLRTSFTPAKGAYFEDFGGFGDLVRTYRRGFAQDGRYSAYRGRRHGAPIPEIEFHRIVAFGQNHDQVGNGGQGRRLAELVDFETVKLSAALVLLSPFLPMLFMGEEYAEKTPFHFFTSLEDGNLVEALRRGRKEELDRFRTDYTPMDPQSAAAFQGSILGHEWSGRHRVAWDFYRELIHLRHSHAAFLFPDREGQCVEQLGNRQVMSVLRQTATQAMLCVFQCEDQDLRTTIPLLAGKWRILLASADRRWDGPGIQFPEHLEEVSSRECLLPRRSVVVLVSDRLSSQV